MNRVEETTAFINKMFLGKKDKYEIMFGCAHLIGVAGFAELLAMKRGLDKEICKIAGLLHDYITYETGESESHAKRGSKAVYGYLDEIGGFSEDEKRLISSMIRRHGAKRKVDGDYEEVLKDADTLSHYFNSPDNWLASKEMDRFSALCIELGLSIDGFKT